MAGFDFPTSGGIIVDGKEVAGPGLDRMVVFQSFALMPWLTTFDNVKVAVRSAYPDWSREQIDAHTQKYIDTMGLTGAEKKRPALLSGGMRQRVGLARAFCVDPKVLLLDEPFAQIDALTRGVIQDELMRMWEAANATVFMVTHDVDEAILLSDRIALMTNGPNAEARRDHRCQHSRVPRTREQMIEIAGIHACAEPHPALLDQPSVQGTRLAPSYARHQRPRCRVIPLGGDSAGRVVV